MRSGDARIRLPAIARPKTLIVCGLVVALVGATGFFVGIAVPSSAGLEEAATAPPPHVSAAVEMRSVTPPKMTQGTVSAGDVETVGFSGLNGSGVLPYVTQVAATDGSPVANGQLLLAVAGQPRIALRVSAPLYRHLHVGDTGTDVTAFEAALSAAGGEDFDVDDELTANTVAAAETLWESLGYELPTEAAVPTPVASAPPADAQQPQPSSAPSPAATASSPPSAIEQPYIDVTQIVQLSTDTTTVVSISGVGDLASTEKPLATLSTSPRRIAARVTVLDEQAFTVGAPVNLRISGQADQQAAVSALGDFVVSDGSATSISGRDIYIDLPAAWVEVADETTVVVSTPDGGAAVLAVPLTAVRDAATDPYVVVEAATGFDGGERVPVTVIASSDGWAQIGDDAGLAEGDTVEVSP